MARVNPMFRSDYSRFAERVDRRYKKYRADRRLKRAGLGFPLTISQARKDKKSAQSPAFAELDGGLERL